MRRKPLQAPDIICKSAKRLAVLEAVVNPTNLGAIIRSAAALNVDGILLTKDCVDPLYRRCIRVSMGNEGLGLSDKTVSNADYLVKIPMSHGVDSLNVAAASAIAFWELG